MRWNKLKLYFLKQDALEILRINIGQNLDKYKEPENDWIYEYFDGDPFIEFKEEVPDFKLKSSRGGVSKIEVENSKILHKNLKGILTPSQASDERFWAGLTHGAFWEYMYNRWEMDIKETSEDSIYVRYFLKGNIKRALRANSLARLWWLSEKLYDEKREDPYELLEAFSHDFVTKVHTFLSLRISNSRLVNRSLAEAIIYLEQLEEGWKYRRDLFRALLRYLNILGGVNILDFYEEEVLADTLIDEGISILDKLQKEE